MKWLAIVIGLVFVGGLAYWFAQSSLSGKTTNDFYDGNGAVALEAATTKDAATTESTTIPAMHATIYTNKGAIELELFGSIVPNTVANFTKLAQEGFYNGTKFHRVIKDFMIQGGDPLTKDDAQAARWGTGGPGYTFADEITAQNKNVMGTISMANAGPNTNGSQFFINTKDNSFLDPKHTVFGKVTSGLDVVLAISEVETGPQDRPVEPIVVEKIEVR